MTKGQELAFEHYWPQAGLQLADGMISPETVFGRSAPLVFEIGFGMGQSLLEMAERESDKDFIGVEVHKPGVGRLLMGMGEAELSNVRAYCDDAVEVLEQCIPDGALSRVQVYFPDPWHKKKHHKRRLIQPGFVALLRRKLKAGGVLHLATDWENYAEHMLEVMEAAPGYRNQAGQGQFSPRPEWRPLTKFEQRGQRLGHGVWDLLYQTV
ncbi:tRNA (guanosine(46)-N7)-methyltransferase TrmB [Litorivivens lipolytica]|nr:tRNA (guanosine(46)-N7)-methyltransferase TrmB [Litorivivens lipolytica]